MAPLKSRALLALHLLHVGYIDQSKGGIIACDDAVDETSSSYVLIMPAQRNAPVSASDGTAKSSVDTCILPAERRSMSSRRSAAVADVGSDDLHQQLQQQQQSRTERSKQAILGAFNIYELAVGRLVTTGINQQLTNHGVSQHPIRLCTKTTAGDAALSCASWQLGRRPPDSVRHAPDIGFCSFV